MRKKNMIISALATIAFTLGMSTGEAQAKRDHSEGRTVKQGPGKAGVKNRAHKKKLRKKKMMMKRQKLKQQTVNGEH